MSRSYDEGDAPVERPQYLVMVKKPVIEVRYSDCTDARVPSHIVLPRHEHKNPSLPRATSVEDTVICPKSDEPHRRYWKAVIATYMMHYGQLTHNIAPEQLFALRKFPVGYELFAKERYGNTRSPDQYLIGFDRHGERKILFDSPYAFVLHGIWLAHGGRGRCPCKVCDDQNKQADIRKILRSAAPLVSIPGITTFKKQVGVREDKKRQRMGEITNRGDAEMKREEWEDVERGAQYAMKPDADDDEEVIKEEPYDS